MTETSVIVGKVDYKFVSKGWGYEKWIWNDANYCGKLLFITKDRRCSWHYHKIKDEVFFIQDGELRVTYGWSDDREEAQTVILVPGDVFHVPTGLRHQMYGVRDTHFFEFSTQHWDEDSIRIIRGD